MFIGVISILLGQYKIQKDKPVGLWSAQLYTCTFVNLVCFLLVAINEVVVVVV